MGNLSNLYISASFQTLLHTGNNGVLSSSLTDIQDGFGNSSGVSLNNQGDLSLSGSFTASLQNGYVWIGDVNGKTKTVPTASFAGGGSATWPVSGTPSGLVSGSSQVSYTGLSNIPSGIVSSSNQLTSSFDTRYLNTNGDGVVSGSSQISFTGITNVPSGLVSSSNQIASITGSSLITASFNNGTRDLTFTKGNGTTFAVNIPGGSGSATIDTGSFAITGSNTFTGNQTIAATTGRSGLIVRSGSNEIFTGLTTAGDRWVVSGAAESRFLEIDLPTGYMEVYALNTNFNNSSLFRGTMRTRNVESDGFGVGYKYFIDELSHSLDDGYFLGGQYNSFYNRNISKPFPTSSITDNFLKTGSVNVNVLTFTKGDGSTFDLTVAASGSVVPGTVSGSQQILNYGIFATTGSNNFNGNQSINGNLTVSGSTILSGSNTFIGTQNITGSLSVTGSNSGIIADFISTTGTKVLTIDSSKASANEVVRVNDSLVVTGSSGVSLRVKTNADTTEMTPTLLNVSGSTNGQTYYYGGGAHVQQSVSGSNTFVIGSGKLVDNVLFTNNDINAPTASFGMYYGELFTLKNSFYVDSRVNQWNLFGRLNQSGSFYIQSSSVNLPEATGSGVLTYEQSTGQVKFSKFTNLISASLSCGEFWSTTTQSGSAGVSGSVTFNNSGSLFGVNLVSGSRLTIVNPGTFNIQFSAQIESSAGADTQYIWFRKNGTNIADSATKVLLANNTAQVMTVNILDTAVANDYYELVHENKQGNAKILYEPASGSVPAIPSVIATITQVK